MAPLLFCGKRLVLVVFCVLQGFKTSMKKFVVDYIKNNDFYSSLLLCNGKMAYNQTVPSSFARGIACGDIVRGLGRSDVSFPVACMYRNRLCLVIEPCNDYAVRNFTKEYFSFTDGLYFQYAVARALAARGVRPTLNAVDNLRMFLNSMNNKAR